MFSFAATFDQLWLELSHAVAACRLEPRKSAVHDIRTSSRRLEALLTKALEDHPSAAELHHEVTRALRQLKKLRRLAGPVRDLDVHLHLLRSLRQPNAATQPQLAHEFKTLNRSLERRREKLAANLSDFLDRRELKLEQAFERTAAALQTLKASSPSALATARRWVSRSAADIGQPTGSNLHEFRKQTKSARYLAELQPASTAARELAARIHKLQTAIGNWHDRQLLEQNARRILGKSAQLPTLLQTQARLQRALRLARKTQSY